jgi:uncharacterized membrane protein YfcA
MWFDAFVLGASVLAGAVAAVTGFGIGSLLTPLFALEISTRLAVTAVAVPHAIGTALRFWLLSRAAPKGQSPVDRRVLWSFGLTSAAGGLVGALLHNLASNRRLTLLFGALLLFAAAGEATGFTRRVRFRGHIAWIAGALSGLLGGLVGNQGSIRSAALLGFGLSKQTFVATATAVALFVDGARVPVYLATSYHEMSALWVWIGLATLGVLAGTLLGNGLLARIPEVWFRRILAVVLAILGAAMILNVSIGT